MIRQIRSIMRRLDARSRRLWLMLVPLTALASLLEACCTLGVVILLGQLSRGPKEIAPGWSLDLAASAPWLCAGGAVLYVMRGAVRLFETHVRHSAASGSTHHLLRSLLARYLAAPHVWHLGRHHQELQHRLSAMVREACQRQLYSLLGVAIESVTVLSILVVLVMTSPGVMLGASVIMGMAVAVVLRTSQARMRRIGERNHATAMQVSRRLGELLGSIKEVRLLGLADSCAQDIDRMWGGRAAIEVESGLLSGVPRVALETLFIVCVLAVAGVASAAGVPAHEVLPLIGLYAYAGSRVLPSLSVLVFHMGEIRFHSAALRSLNEEFDELDAILAESPATPAPREIAHGLTLERAGFTYPSRVTPALTDVTLELPRGSWTGIAGPSGAGKSTLVDLLLGALTPTEGRVLVDGRPTAGALPLPGRVAYVPQNAFIHEGTLLENVAPGAGVPDRQRALACLRRMQLGELVERLPRGLDSMVGDRGLNMSSGQRQRLALARALYLRPSLLVLDEATAALDRPTEDNLLAALAELRGEITVVLVSHRMSALSRCDRIAVLSHGQVVSQGTHDELLETSPLFKNLARPAQAVA